MGIGIKIMVEIEMIDGNMRRKVKEKIKEKEKDLLLVDIKKKDMGDLKKMVRGIVKDGKMKYGKMMRGRIVDLKGKNVREMKIKKEEEWVMRGERGIKFEEKVNEKEKMREGEWWNEDYRGEKMV